MGGGGGAQQKRKNIGYELHICINNLYSKGRMKWTLVGVTSLDSVH